MGCHLRSSCNSEERKKCLGKDPADTTCYTDKTAGQRKFTMLIEPHTPNDPSNVCRECALARGPMCLDRSYCEWPTTGKTWKKSITP